MVRWGDYLENMVVDSLVLLLQPAGDFDGFLFRIEEFVTHPHFVFKLVSHFVIFLPKTCQELVPSKLHKSCLLERFVLLLGSVI